MKHKNIKLGLALLLITASAFSAADMQAMAESNPLKITAEAKKKSATVRITGAIWGWSNISEWFRGKIEKFNADGVTNLHVYINTPGGDVFQANEIYNEIKAFKGTVTGEGGALVASAGTYIALACDTFEMPSNGQWMYHKPHGVVRGNEDEVESSLQLLKNITADYKKSYAEKTKLTETQIENKWVKGDVWLSAKQALKDGFITGIKKEPAKITKDAAALFAAIGCPVEMKATAEPKKPQQQKQKPSTMTELEALALKLGLPQDATQAQVDAKLAEVQAKASKADQLELDAQQKEKDDQKKAVKAMFDGAVKDKKLTAKQVAGMQGWAESDFDGCKAHIDALPTIEAISRGIKGNTTPSAAATAVADKDFDALTQDEMDTLAEEDPEAFTAKYNAYLEKKEN